MLWQGDRSLGTGVCGSAVVSIYMDGGIRERCEFALH
jgi:hypothetical protein